MSGPNEGLPLFEAVEGNTVRKITDRGEERHAAWMDRVRRLVFGCYRGQEVTTDEVWWVLDRYGIAIPEGASPNLLGSFYSGWDLARAATNPDGSPKWCRSKRVGAHANLLKVWKLSQ